MKTILAAAITFFALSPAYASVRLETDCNFSDCAHQGWETIQWGASNRSSTTCKNGDCFANGWVTLDSHGSRVDVTCQAGGCWVGGWDDVQMVNGHLYSAVTTCTNSSCLTDGWQTHSSTGAVRFSGCVNKDCAHIGWDSWGGGNSSITRCKMSDCFRSGWTVDVF